MVFGVIVDHCLGHNLVIFKTGCFGKMPCKKCGDLVYIEIKVRQHGGFNITAVGVAAEHFFNNCLNRVIFFHDRAGSFHNVRN